MIEVRRVSLSDIHIDPSNARRHPDRNIQTIIGSLKTFGQVEPLVVQKGTGKIIGGNGRYVAMREAGITEADVYELDIDDLKATALGIALNRTAELAEWDEDVLERIAASLKDDPELFGSVGFSAEELSGPKFDPIPEDQVGRLDQKKPVTCPECGHEFTP